ncbi:MAG: glycosyltransferase family 9 protein, partial [bacterium]
MKGKFPPSIRPKKILIIKFSHIGDLVCTIPVLRGLRKTFPDVHIAWLIVREWADVIKRDPDLNETIIFDRKEIDRSWYKPKGIRMYVDLLRKIRAEKFDWVIDLQGHIKSAFFGLISGAPVRVGFSYAREGAPL